MQAGPQLESFLIFVLMRVFTWLFLCLFLWSACRTVEDDFLPTDQSDYFPLALGQERIYELDSIVFDLNAAQRIDSAHLFWREVVADTFRDAGGELWYTIERYQRQADTLPWVFSQTLAASRENGRAFWLENNLKFVKLVFPFDEFTFWDGNAYIPQGVEITVGGETLKAFDDWSYGVDHLAEADTLQSKIYEQVAFIREAESENLISLRLAESRYARGVGLIYRAWTILDTQVLDEAIPWEEKAEKGFVLKQWLIATNF